MDFNLHVCGPDNGPVELNFDFDAFLRDEDMNYVVDESSGSNTLSDRDDHSPTTANGLLTTMPPSTMIVPGRALGSNTALGQSLMSRGNPHLSPSAASSSAALSKHRMERKGHTKSRRGCFNCKRRRIKVGKQHEQ